MSAQPATARRPSGRAARSTRARRRQVWRRRLILAAGLAAVIVAVVSLVRPVDHAVEEIKLPLRHEDIIRQQAADKRVDAALIAAVIYTESHFRDQTSHAGAKGLMQLMPETADYIARKSGGTRFERADLATPQINIAYGTWYLRYLLAKYHGNTVLALAAYNAGEGKVDEWWAAASSRGEKFRVADHIPFPETRDYVHRVLSARRDYRRSYARELGL
jgi:soluble lytic murein transglycosylase